MNIRTSLTMSAVVAVALACASGGSSAGSAHLASIPRYDTVHPPDCPYSVLARLEVDDGWFGDEPEMVDAARRRKRDQDRQTEEVLTETEADALMLVEEVGTLSQSTRLLFIRWTEPGCVQ